MTDLTTHDAVQISKALEVLRLLHDNPRMTQEKACANVGISPPTYRKWIATQDDALVTFEEVLQEVERVEYSRLLIVKNAMTDKLINSALRDDVSVTERIKALQYVEGRLDELGNRYHTVDIDVEKDLLNGPTRQLGVSQSLDRVNVEVSNNEVVVRVKDPPQIVDVDPL